MSVMTMVKFIQGSAGMGPQLLWRFAAFTAVLGLVWTQTTPSAFITDWKPGSPTKSIQMATPMSSNLTTIMSVVVETNSTETGEMKNETLSTTKSWNTSSLTTLLTAATTEPSLTTVTMAMTAVTTPREQTTLKMTPMLSKQTTTRTKHQDSVPMAATQRSDLVTSTGKMVPAAGGNLALYLLLPLIIFAGVALLVMIVSYLRKRIRLDKLRHQLLPLYNFDPQEGEDWETELLTDPRSSSQPSHSTTKPKSTTAIAEIPKLRFSPDTVDV
ncbi:uncharacterized protein LOC110989755 [Acanthaster planci]|uniref:Uncharacterized protein LOC110989755 n=1 Tax=Acanthaster planci TaxID=133434 RepID=A0A8B7ZZA2_ACAPL|nr:uncharacterized protein LOC110989755 [Acanthaster planci]